MTKSAQAIVKPEMLIWARKSAGLSMDEAANKIGTSKNRLEKWEEGDSRPTIKQLRIMGRVYKRPLAVFYLPKPPKDFDALRDFRRHPGKPSSHISSELRFHIRHAAEKRDIALELYDFLDEEPPAFNLETNLEDDPEEFSYKIRFFLKIDFNEQLFQKNPYNLLNYYKKLYENNGILVFQNSIPLSDDVRGFSIFASKLPVIVINSKDSPYARIFTMFHELVHLALKINGICDLDEENVPPEEKQIEVFCNHVAGAALVPKNFFQYERFVRNKTKQDNWDDSEIHILSQRYGVSREVIMRRLLILDKTTPHKYKEWRNAFQKEYEQEHKSNKTGFVPSYRKVISQSGNLFTRLVLDNYYQDHITASDVSDFLEVKLNQLPKIEQVVY